MMRFLLWMALWVLSLGTLESEVKYSDGLTIRTRNVWKRKKG